MKTLFYWALVGLAVLIVVAVATCAGDRQAARDSAAAIDHHLNDTLQYWRDEAGRQHARRAQVEADLKTLQIADRKLIDSITDALNIKAKQLRSITAASTKATGTVVATRDTVLVPIAGDSTMRPALRIHYDDRWLSLTAYNTDPPLFHYSYRDSLIVTSYTRRKGLFRRETVVDAYSLNPAATVTGLRSMVVAKERPKRFGVGPYIGYGWDGSRWAPSAGISFQYSLIRF